MSVTIKKFAVAEDSLKCKTGCGYFGSYSFQGYCSKCYREIYQKSHSLGSVGGPIVEFGRTDRPLNQEKGATLQLHSPASKFGRFNEKKKFQTEKKYKVKTLLSKPSKDTGHVKAGRQLSEETLSVTEEFTNFLKTLNKPIGDDINKETTNFLKRIDKIIQCVPVEELANMVQDFYQSFAEKFRHQGLVKDSEVEPLDELLDSIEKRIMTEMYKAVFPIVSSNCEDEDIALQKRIRSLNWVNAFHLDCGLDESSFPVSEQVLEAITALLEMDSKRAPQDKLLCVVSCSKLLCNILQESQDRPASADEFLPALIYVIIKGNPPRLHSNIDYISRFCNPSKLLSGEAGYYFTNLCCAVTFISDLNADSLNLSEDEFERYMSGDALPPGSWNQSFRMCEGLRLMEQNMSALKEYKGRSMAVQEQISTLIEDVTCFNEYFLSKIDSIQSKYPLKIWPRKKLAELMNEDVDELSLPSPLSPEIVKNVRFESAKQPLDIEVSSVNMSELQTHHLDTDAGKIIIPEVNTDTCSSPPCVTQLQTAPLKPTIYSGFTAQGERILSIPCETAKLNTVSLPFSYDQTESSNQND